MARRSERFSSGFLKAEEDMTIKGEKALTLTISQVTEEESTFNKGKMQPVAHFEEVEERLGLNGTNWDSCMMISGEPDDANWGGTVVELYVEKVRNPQGKVVPGIRIREPRGASPSKTKADKGELFGEKSGATMVAFLKEHGRTVADMRHGLVTKHKADPDDIQGEPASWPESLRSQCRTLSKWFKENPGETPPWGATPDEDIGDTPF